MAADAMEPSGMMDGDRRLSVVSAKDNFIRTHFSICDVADEEVHFSRDVVASSYLGGNNYPGAAQAAPPSSSTAPSVTGRPSIVGFTDVSLGHLSGSGPASNTTNPLMAEQAKSNKLLHTIGSKLRRGSNYLAAPKLVGQYLLGITIQSWSEFLNTSRLMRAPSNTQQLTRRLLANLNHFQGNYMCVSLVLVIYCILTSPLLLLAIMAYLATLYLVTVRSATGRHLRIAGYRPNLQQQYSFLTLISLPLLWVAGAPSAVFWVIGASFVVVGLHASMYNGEPSAASELVEYQPAPQARSLSASTVQYYNHYHQPTPQQYMPISSPSFSSAAGGKAPSSYSSTFSQWITFGTANGSTRHKLTPAGNRNNGMRNTEVTIISQDYAGLGRVYEV